MARPKKTETVEKPKRKSRKIKEEIKSSKVKVKTKSKKEEVSQPIEEEYTYSRANIAKFLSGKIEKVENKTGMVANVAKYLKPQSYNSLCLDWCFNGGAFNQMTIVSGFEQSGKTSVTDELLASGLRSNFVFSSKIDAEGTMNDAYFAAMLRKIGLSPMQLEDNPNTGFRYYKENVIETVFDYMVGLLNLLPRKIWNTHSNTWTYHVPKRDKYFEELMQVYNIKPDSKLTNDKYYVCPTDYDGIEAAFYVDSFAAMLTERDEEEGERSKIRAAEAQAFSNHLKRVSAKIANRGVLTFGVNQSRKIPNSNGYGPTSYQPGGEALKFYSGSRAEFTSRGSGYRSGISEYDKKMKSIVEESIDGGLDKYVYKHVKNTKNKTGNPNKETWIRIWTADSQGMVHGIDPAFDLIQYLEHTNQIIKTDRKKGNQNYKFNLKPSVGSKRANLLNSLPAFTELDLKALTLSEVFQTKEMIRIAQDRMGLSKKVGLRKALFDQIQSDKSVLAITNAGKSKQDDEDYEDDVTEL